MSIGLAQQLLAGVEERRQIVSADLAAKHRARFGQFFTPLPTARFLADLIELPAVGTFRLLDPGAGVGSLAAAVVARAIEQGLRCSVHITAFEIDSALAPHLERTLEECAAAAAGAGICVSYDRRGDNFIDYCTGWLLETPETFDACIANPPYRKVSTTAPERVACEAVGLRASNLYTQFLGLAVDRLVDDGQLSAIVPRSFANGPYHEPFRRWLLERCGLELLHVYESRGKVFADADVLQENVVLRAVRGDQSDTVTLSTSAGNDDPRVTRIVSASEVVHPDDPHAFVRIPMDARDTRIAEQMADLPATLSELGVAVSTGRVVDFRARESLRQDPGDDTVPLVYPGHLRDGRIAWPTPGSKKPNALHRSEATDALVLPSGTYVVVKRFSAKEEPRRVVAAVAGPDDLPGDEVGFENHLNVYHQRNQGIDPLLALGLAGYLNSRFVDDFVRAFSGHTQINATDLRQLRYPDVDDLARLGAEIDGRPWPCQAELDDLLDAYLPARIDPGLRVPTAA